MPPSPVRPSSRSASVCCVSRLRRSGGFATLEIVDGGKWSTQVRKDAVEFVHEVNDPASGYGYRYTKTVALPPGKTQMTLTQRLESTGVNPIDTEMYNHNFFVLDGQPSGPDVEVRVPFKLEAFNVRGDAIQIGSDRLNYLKPIETANRMQLKGFSASASRLRHPRGKPQDGSGRARHVRSPVVRHGVLDVASNHLS